MNASYVCALPDLLPVLCIMLLLFLKYMDGQTDTTSYKDVRTYQIRGNGFSISAKVHLQLATYFQQDIFSKISIIISHRFHVRAEDLSSNRGILMRESGLVVLSSSASRMPNYVYLHIVYWIMFICIFGRFQGFRRIRHHFSLSPPPHICFWPPYSYFLPKLM